MALLDHLRVAEDEVHHLKAENERLSQRVRDLTRLAEARLDYMNFLSRKVEALRVRVADLAISR